MLSAAARPPRRAATDCIDLFSREFGTHQHPNFVMDVLRQGAKVGQPIILFRTSNTTRRKTSVTFQGTTSDFFAAGLVSSAVALHYGWRWATIVARDPTARRRTWTSRFETSTRLTAWTAACAWAWPAPPSRARASASSRVASRPGPVWILDLNDSPPTFSHDYVPLINGSDTNFSHPFVLTYPKNGFPTDKPRPQLLVQNLTGFSHGFGRPISAP